MGASPDVSRNLGHIVWVVVTATAAMIVVCLRFYVRMRVVRAIGWDDWTILVALVIQSSLDSKFLLDNRHRVSVFSAWLSTQYCLRWVTVDMNTI